jgi:3-hydroxyacyl-CoA dehydrogenase
MSRPSESVGTAAIVGTGLVGRAWAIAFARGGWQVRL